MCHEQPFDLDEPPASAALLRGVVRARTVEEACVAAQAALSQCCVLTDFQLVWLGEQPQLLSASDTPRIEPDSDTLATLAQGEPVAAGEQGLFVPLFARGELSGWMYLAAQTPADIAGMAQLVADQLGPVLALHIAAQAHDQRVRYLQTLTDIGRQISGELDLESLLNTIYHAASRVVDVADFSLALYDSPTNEFHLVYAIRNRDRIPAPIRWNANQGLSGVVLRRRTTIYAYDYLAECQRYGVVPISDPTLAPSNIWLGIPLIANDAWVGVMTISSLRSNYHYTQEQIDLLTAIGMQAAVALAAAKLYQRSERQAQQLAALNEIGRNITSSLDPQQVPSLIMDQVCRLLDVTEGSLLLTDEATGDLVFAYANGPVGDTLLGKRVPRGMGIAGHVAQTGESVIVNDVRDDKRFYDETDKSTGFTTRTLLAVALRGVGGIEGVIEVMNRIDESAFTVEDRQLLEAIASQAVIALANARRFAQVDQALARRAQELATTNAMLQHNLQSLTALNALSMALSTSLRDAQDIYTMTAHGAIAASDAAGATILLVEQNRLRQTVHVGVTCAQQHIEALSYDVVHSGRPQLEQFSLGQTLLAVPLRTPQRMLGVLCVCYTQHAPDSSDQEAVVLFATQAAAAVVNNELFAQLRSAHDQMASILASTREGIALITTDGTLAHANDALHRLAHLETHETHGVLVDDCLKLWQGRVAYPVEEWQQLREKLADVTTGQVHFASGCLSAPTAAAPSLEWVALPVRGSSIVGGGVVLVLRDITEARQAERMRQDLTNMIVHDLRSPLSSVMAAIDMLIKGISGVPSAAQQKMLSIAYSSSVQMLDMISTLLDISRLEDGRMPLALQPAPIRPAIMQATERLRTLAQERSIAILDDGCDGFPHVVIDRELIVRVVQNLLGNAIKFSSHGSTVLLRAHVEEGGEKPMLCVAVRDRGIGIAPQDQEHVFTKFGQVGESRGGSGLGLTFCKLVIEAHGGKIWLESQPGAGSTFFFTVPLAGEKHLAGGARA